METKQSTNSLQRFKQFAQNAKFESTANQQAILKLCILTGLGDFFLDIMNIIREQENKTKLTDKNNPLADFVGKSGDELSNIIEQKDIEKIFSFVGDKDGINISEEDFNKTIVKFTQLIWFSRTQKQERWDVNVTKFNGIKDIKKIIIETGILLHESNDLTVNTTNTIAILGATLEAMRQRLKYAIDEKNIKEKIEQKQFYFLVSDRLINKTEREYTDLLKKVSQIYENKLMIEPLTTVDKITEYDCA